MLGPSSRPDISPLTGSIWPYRRRLCSRNTVLRSSQGRWFIFDVDVSPRRSTSVLGACGLSALHAPSRYPVLKVPAAAPVAPVPCGKGIYCQTPAAAGAGIGASTMCTPRRCRAARGYIARPRRPRGRESGPPQCAHNSEGYRTPPKQRQWSTSSDPQ